MNRRQKKEGEALIRRALISDDRVSVSRFASHCLKHESMYVCMCTRHRFALVASEEAGQGAVIDRVIKHLAILLAESLVAKGKGEARYFYYAV